MSSKMEHMKYCTLHFYQSHARVDRTFVSLSGRLGSIPSRLKPITCKLVFTAYLLHVQY